jgi:hypothetical protein
LASPNRLQLQLMNMLILGVGSLLAASVIGRQVLKRGIRHRPGTKQKSAEYRCVAIQSGDCTCPDIEKLEGQRFLPEEAPRLPLPECTAGICQCRYEHHDDRRQDLRRHPYGILASTPPLNVGHDRRFRRDRRT